MIINPTVGRVVWWWPLGSDSGATGANPPQPFAAIVTFVHHKRKVNLAVYSHSGHHFGLANVPLLQEDDPANPDGGYCQWMPYQKGQAAKTEALEAKLTG